MDKIVFMPVSVSEALDRLSILSIKLSKGADVKDEFDALAEILGEHISSPKFHQLEYVNEQLWQVLDQQREMESAGIFGEEYVSLACQVGRLNDLRCAIKRDQKIWQSTPPPTMD